MTESIPGVVWLSDEPLARHTAWRTGGRCPHFIVVHRAAALEQVMTVVEALPGTPLVLGAGTRTAFRDGAYDRGVIRLGTEFARIQIDGSRVEVGAAAPCPALVWATAAEGLSGLADLVRTPGTLGSALCLDESTWREHLTEVLIWSRGGARWRAPDKIGSAKLILGARFDLPTTSVDAARAGAVAALKGATALPSWYKSLRRGRPGDEIIRAGAAGVRLRAAVIPPSAPELIVNGGRGSAADLLLLHRSAIERVAKLRGVELESSFTFLGRS
jgi:UDP-N-acetylmuramate dehydrogenase